MSMKRLHKLINIEAFILFLLNEACDYLTKMIERDLVIIAMIIYKTKKSKWVLRCIT